MSNPYYSNTGYPQFRAPGKSDDMRAELKRIEGGLDRLPDPIVPNQPVFGNASGTGMAMKDKGAAKALLDLDKVDNTSDADKPISAATAASLADKADITYVDTELADKADITYVDAGLANTQADVALLPTVSDFNITGNIINGDFQVAQEGTTHNSQGYGSIDGVFLDRVGSGLSVSQEFFTLGQADVPGEPVNYARFTVNSVAGANNFASYQHRIPDVRNYAGGKCFVAFDAKADVAGKAIGVRLDQRFGTGGSANVLTPVQIKTLSNTWTGDWHVFEFDVPSIAGKTIGTNKNDFIAVTIVFDIGPSFSDYTGVGQKSGIYDICKLRVVRNLWELNHYRQDYNDALDECKRYLQYIDGAIGSGRKYCPSAGLCEAFSVTLPIEMARIPVHTQNSLTFENCTFHDMVYSSGFLVCRVNPVVSSDPYRAFNGTIKLDARV